MLLTRNYGESNQIPVTENGNNFKRETEAGIKVSYGVICS